jgi:hypothetical protein
VALKETFFGDSTLDGTITPADYSQIDANDGATGAAASWFNGDFNYDATVNAADYSLIDQSYVFQTSGGPTLPTAPLVAALSATADGGGSAVPEPTSVGLLALAAGGFLGRRRRVHG